MISKGSITLSTIRLLSLSVLVGFSLSWGSSSFADNQVVTERQVNNVQGMQEKSIEQGVKVGKLTPKEAKKLRDEQYEINELERQMRANGSLNTDELRILFKRLEEARNNINKLLRNSISSYVNLDETEVGDRDASRDTH